MVSETPFFSRWNGSLAISSYKVIQSGRNASHKL